MTNLGAVAILTVARSSLQHCAGSGMPLPYSGRCSSAVPPRDCTPRALPRASRSGRHVGLRPPRNDKSGNLCGRRSAWEFADVHAAQGTPLQTQSVCAFYRRPVPIVRSSPVFLSAGQGNCSMTGATNSRARLPAPVCCRKTTFSSCRPVSGGQVKLPISGLPRTTAS